MQASRHRYVSSSWVQVASLLVACAALVLFGSPHRSAATDDGALTAPLGVDLHYADVQRVLGEHGKGLDRGTFDVMQVHFPVPTAWVFVEDDTVDGMGVEYWAVHPTFIAPGPGAPNVDLSYSYRPEVNHTTLQEFLDWIVENNPHVMDASELLVYRSEAAPI